ncbi:uncharacterized protein F4822DRAFT_388334 [Hypoxylon trugodes]|uniref:uncharacterized protein n=1 Tax=Hypoxylon trugodes TaxID=326681 RepID=UPI0021A05D76|nr:uncharacterized protein F4822DRAFT_388334 [Hypoxylon trugodes]KAI1391748.1 hypothetical protein F4822DRAFT_388334 [Hypoxylon trugodes]
MASTPQNHDDDNRQRADPKEEWTRVRRKGKRHFNASQYITSPNHNSNPYELTSRLSFLSVSDIEREHRQIAKQWEVSICCRQLQEIIASRVGISNVTEAICFGLGSFDPKDGSWEVKRRAHVQLAAFRCMVNELQRGSSHGIRCVFQEPLFNSSDKAFIHSLGYEVVDSPEGFEQVRSSTLVFGIHLYKDIYAQAIANYAPAVFVGTPQEVWEE